MESFLFLVDLWLGYQYDACTRLNIPETVTATFGGIMRDILCCKPVRIVHSHAEIYSVTAITGASVFVGLRQLGLPPVFRIMGGVLSAVSMRYWATKYNITLPVASWFNPNKLPPAARQGNDVILMQKNDVTQPVIKAVITVEK